MFEEESAGALASWGAFFLPSLVVVLFNLLRLRMPPLTAGGLAFLAAVLLACFFFPRLRVRPRRVALAFGLAVGVGLLMTALP
jgi:peptidoglycan biosynthesis protein MviN/MurJ (putative lipid II flippase)